MSDIQGKLSRSIERDTLGVLLEGLTAVLREESAKRKIEDESKCSAQLDDIFTELHERDARIAKDLEDTIHLATETRTMLTDLRNQFS